MSFLDEIKKRNVLRVGAAYLVVSWLVLQFIDVVFPMLGIDESWGKPVLLILLVGLPIALLLAWFLEITPDGVRREKDLDRSAMADQPVSRKMDRAIIIVLVAALSLLLFDRFILKSAPPTEIARFSSDRSLAVLPFVNLSGKTEDEYFSDGLTETLLHMLAQVPELKVSARTSVFAFKGKVADVRDIAEGLGVAAVLEGSVQRSGNKVRITAQLIEAATGFNLWSHNFDRDLDDIFAVQDEIASSVVSALQVTLLGVDNTAGIQMAGIATKNTEAYELYLQALEQKNIASYSSLPLAESLFKRALSQDPDFCEAKLELAYAYQLQAETGLLTRDESESRIRPLIDQVLEIRPEEGRALGLLASINWRNAVLTDGPVSAKTAAAQADLLRALKLAPNDPALYVAMAQVNVALNDPEEAVAWTEKGLVVDPLSARLHMQRGQILLQMLDRPEEAVEAFAAAREQAADWTAVLISSGLAEFGLGNFAGGIEWYLTALDEDPQDHEIPSNLARYYYQFGLDDEGDGMYERARAIAPQEPWTRGLELERQLRADNFERAALLAEAIIRDDLENRGNAFGLAVGGYVSSMIELGQGDRVPLFFESLLPGISEKDYRPSDIKEAGIKFMIALSLAQTGSYDIAQAILDPLIAGADATAPGWREVGGLMMTVAIAQGDQDAAIQYALDDLSRPLSEQLDWDLRYRHLAWVKPLLRNDRIASRLAELEVETQAAAEKVSAMLVARGVEAG